VALAQVNASVPAKTIAHLITANIGKSKRANCSQTTKT